MRQVVTYDTTLRDGAQGEGISFSVADKLEVVHLLDDLKMDYIEGGWPGSNAKDLMFFRELQSVSLQHSRVVAFTSTRRKGQKIEEDEHMQTVLNTGLRHCAVVGKTWDFHVETALRTDLQENLRMIEDTIRFLKEREIEAIFDAEHFFDGFKRNPDYALRCLETAFEAGADWLVLCDTNGGTLPSEVEQVVKHVHRQGLTRLGIHAHNDGALAVANSLAAVGAGATQVQGTINGFGERCGNTDLCALIPNIVLKEKYVCHMESSELPKLKAVSDRLYRMVGKAPVSSQPFVGDSAFAHKAGIHVSAVLRDPTLYEHMDPTQVGNRRRVLVSELSGESNVVYTLQQLGYSAPKQTVTRILQKIKQFESEGVVFEGAETSLELLILTQLEVVSTPLFMNASQIGDVEMGGQIDLTWTELDGHTQAVSVTGSSFVTALSDALLLNGRMQLVEHKITEISGVLGKTRYRALTKTAWQGRELTTTAVAETLLAALAESLYQARVYVQVNEQRRLQMQSETNSTELVQ